MTSSTTVQWAQRLLQPAVFSPSAHAREAARTSAHTHTRIVHARDRARASVAAGQGANARARRYQVALDKEHMRQLVLHHTIPPLVTEAGLKARKAEYIEMGFPRVR